MDFGVRTHLWAHPQDVVHQREEEEGFPLVFVPQVLGGAHFLALVLAHALGYGLAPGGLALPLAQMDKTQRGFLGRRRTLEAQSNALGKS